MSDFDTSLKFMSIMALIIMFGIIAIAAAIGMIIGMFL